MAGDALREDMKSDGEELLKLAEKLGMAPAAAAWLFDHQLGEWRYYLVSELVHVLGRKTLYDHLARALKKSALSTRLSIVDVYLAGPDDVVFDLIGSCIRVRDNSRIEVKECHFNGFLVDAYIYIWDGDRLGQSEAHLEKVFKQSVHDYFRVSSESTTSAKNRG